MANVMALVTVKGFSKRVPKKSFRDFCGKPLYQWTTDFIETVKNKFAVMVFSSDVPDSFDISPEFIKVQRPIILCEDFAPHGLSVQHALVETENGCRDVIEYVMLFQVTNPLRYAGDVDLMLGELDRVAGNTCLGTSYTDHNLKVSYMINYGGYGSDCPRVHSGNLYVYSREFLLKTYDQCRFPAYHFIEIPKERGYNLNVDEDFAIAEAFARRGGYV